MTGRVEALEGNRVTIGGETYDFGEGVRWLLEVCAHEGWCVEVVVDKGRIVQVMRVPEVGT